MSDQDQPGGEDAVLVRNFKANKWTIGVITLGLFLNLGLSHLGAKHTLTWHEINSIRQWKEIVFSIVVGQSGKAVRKWKERSDDLQDGTPRA